MIEQKTQVLRVQLRPIKEEEDINQKQRDEAKVFETQIRRKTASTAIRKRFQTSYRNQARNIGEENQNLENTKSPFASMAAYIPSNQKSVIQSKVRNNSKSIFYSPTPTNRSINRDFQIGPDGKLVKVDLRKSIDSKKSLDNQKGKMDLFSSLKLPHRILKAPVVKASPDITLTRHREIKNIQSRSPLAQNNDGELREEEYSKYSSNFKQKMEELRVEQVLNSEKRSYQYKVKERIKEILRKCCPSIVKNENENLDKLKQSLNQNQELEENILSKEMDQVLCQLTEEEKIQKAVRHFYDSYFLRTPRNDIDGKNKQLVHLIWKITNDSHWNNFLWIISFIYQMQALGEPTNQQSEVLNKESFLVLAILEGIWLFFILLDVVLNVIFCLLTQFQQKIENEVSDGQNVIEKNKKLIFKVSFMLILLSDYFNNIFNYPRNTLRYSRAIRSFFLISYSKDLRRNFVGILKSVKDLLLLFLLYIIIIFLWAFIGINLLGDLKEIVPIDNLSQNYDQFFNLSFMLYIFSTLDYFPDIMLPTIAVSRYYLFYFIPFLLLFLFLFIPVPQALLYESFREHRQNIEWRDSYKQKKAMAICFYCLDLEKNGEITFQQTFNFFKNIYRGQSREKDIANLLKLIDFDESGTYSLDEFFYISYIANKYGNYSITRPNPLQCWESLLQNLNQKFKLQQFIEGVTFGMIMIGLTLINCALIICALFIEDEKTLEIFEIIDKIFFGLYTFEVILKILGLGIYNYFDDIWNKFDFSIIFLQLFFDFILINTISAKVSSSVKANRVLRLAKIQKIFRLFRAFRSFKVFNVVLDGLAIFEDVKELFYKIILCVPVVVKFVIVIWVLFYSYAVISVEILSSSLIHESSLIQCDTENMAFSLNIPFDWGQCEYSNFDTIENALLMFLKIFIFSWADVVNEYSHRFGSYWVVCLFLGIFVFFSIFLLALFNGLVWEVFNRIEQTDEINLDELLKLNKSNDQSIVLQSEIKYDEDDNQQQDQIGSFELAKIKESDQEKQETPQQETPKQETPNQVISKEDNKSTPLFLTVQEPTNIQVKNDYDANMDLKHEDVLQKEVSPKRQINNQNSKGSIVFVKYIEEKQSKIKENEDPVQNQSDDQLSRTRNKKLATLLPGAVHAIRCTQKKKSSVQIKQETSDFEFSDSDDFIDLMSRKKVESVDFDQIFFFPEIDDPKVEKSKKCLLICLQVNVSEITKKQKKFNTFQKQSNSDQLTNQETKYQNQNDDMPEEKLLSTPKEERDKHQFPLLMISDPTLFILYPQFQNYEKELEFIFNQSMNYFKNAIQSNAKVDPKMKIRKTLKAQLGYQKNEVEEQQMTIMEQQQQLIFHFGFLLKSILSCKKFIEVLLNLDQIITNYFLQEDSFTKFIFQTQDNVWFTLIRKKKKILYRSIGEGPWQTYQHIFKTKKPHSPDHNIYFYQINREKIDEVDEFEQKLIDQINTLSFVMKFDQNQQEISNCEKRKSTFFNKSTKKKILQTEILISVFPMDNQKAMHPIKNIIQIWNLKKPPEEVERKATYLQVLNQGQRSSNILNIIQLSDAVDKKSPSIEHSNIGEDEGKHPIKKQTFLQSLNLCKDIWKMLRGKEEVISEKLLELQQQRQKKKKL